MFKTKATVQVGNEATKYNLKDAAQFFKESMEGDNFKALEEGTQEYAIGILHKIERVADGEQVEMDIDEVDVMNTLCETYAQKQISDMMNEEASTYTVGDPDTLKKIQMARDFMTEAFNSPAADELLDEAKDFKDRMFELINDLAEDGEAEMTGGELQMLVPIIKVTCAFAEAALELSENE